MVIIDFKIENCIWMFEDSYKFFKFYRECIFDESMRKGIRLWFKSEISGLSLGIFYKILSFWNGSDRKSIVFKYI